jgi:hypothetical protein
MEAARLLRVGKSTVYCKLKEYGLSETDYESRPDPEPAPKSRGIEVRSTWRRLKSKSASASAPRRRRTTLNSATVDLLTFQ